MDILSEKKNNKTQLGLFKLFIFKNISYKYFKKALALA